MNILILNGSPRKKGNTNILTEHLIKHLPETINTETVYLYDYEIRPCTDCRACKKGDMVCVLKDSMQKLYTKIEQSDVIVVGTPIYWFGPTAKTKLLLDRFRPFYGNKRLSGKKMALLLPAGDGAKDCDLTTEMFKRAAKALEVDFIDAVTSKSFDIGDAHNDKDALENIEILAKKIGQ